MPSPRRLHTSANRMMELLTHFLRTVDPTPPFADIPELSDPDDIPVWWAAAAIRAEYVLTNDTAHAPKGGALGRCCKSPLLQHRLPDAVVRVLHDPLPLVLQGMPAAFRSTLLGARTWRVPSAGHAVTFTTTADLDRHLAAHGLDVQE